MSSKIKQLENPLINNKIVKSDISRPDPYPSLFRNLDS